MADEEFHASGTRILTGQYVKTKDEGFLDYSGVLANPDLSLENFFHPVFPGQVDKLSMQPLGQGKFVHELPPSAGAENMSAQRTGCLEPTKIVMLCGEELPACSSAVFKCVFEVGGADPITGKHAGTDRMFDRASLAEIRTVRR